MTTPQIEFLREICAAPSVSGFEQQAQMIIASYFKPLVDRIESDIHSNVIGIINEGCRSVFYCRPIVMRSAF